MRADEHGLGTGAIIGIVVVVAGVGAVLLLGGGSAGPGGLAVYSGAQEFTEMTIEQAMAMSGQQLPPGWSGKIYTTLDSTAAVAD